MKYLLTYKLFEADVPLQPGKWSWTKDLTIPKDIQLELYDLSHELRDEGYIVSYQWWPPYEIGNRLYNDNKYPHISITKRDETGESDWERIYYPRIKEFCDRVSDYLDEMGYNTVVKFRKVNTNQYYDISDHLSNWGPFNNYPMIMSIHYRIEMISRKVHGDVFESLVDKTGNKLTDRARDFETDIKHIYKDEVDATNIIKVLERDCGPFINELVSTGGDMLFRGISGKPISFSEYKVEYDNELVDGLYIKSRRKDRYTLDIKPDISQIFDDYFQQQFDFRLRSSGVFATKDPVSAASYSQYDTQLKRRKAYMFFPIGEYKYYWNPEILDLFSDIENEPWYYRFGMDDETLHYEWQDIYGDPRLVSWSNHQGHFRLFGKDIIITQHVNKFIDIPKWIIDNKDEFGLIPNEMGCYTKDGKVILCNYSNFKDIMAMEWIPEVTFEDYLEKNKPEEPYDEINKIVSGYKDSGLGEVKRQEITFDCDKYYSIDEKYYFAIKQWLQSKL